MQQLISRIESYFPTLTLKLSPLRKIVALLADGGETVALKVRVPFGVPVCMGLARERLRVSAYGGATRRKTASINMESERAVFFIFIFLRCFCVGQVSADPFSGCELFVFRKRHAEAGAECSAAIGATIAFDDQRTGRSNGRGEGDSRNG